MAKSKKFKTGTIVHFCDNTILFKAGTKCECGASNWVTRMAGGGWVCKVCKKVRKSIVKKGPLFCLWELDGICPQCGDEHHLVVKYGLRCVQPDGESLGFNDASEAWCGTCGFRGCVKDFPYGKG